MTLNFNKQNESSSDYEHVHSETEFDVASVVAGIDNDTALAFAQTLGDLIRLYVQKNVKWAAFKAAKEQRIDRSIPIYKDKVHAEIDKEIPRMLNKIRLFLYSYNMSKEEIDRYLEILVFDHDDVVRGPYDAMRAEFKKTKAALADLKRQKGETKDPDRLNDIKQQIDRVGAKNRYQKSALKKKREKYDLDDSDKDDNTKSQANTTTQSTTTNKPEQIEQAPKPLIFRPISVATPQQPVQKDGPLQHTRSKTKQAKDEASFHEDMARASTPQVPDFIIVDLTDGPSLGLDNQLSSDAVIVRQSSPKSLR